MLTVLDIAEVSAALAANRSRSAKVSRLAALLRSAGAQDIGTAARWCTGEVAERSLGIGPAQVRAALSTQPAAASSLALAGAMQHLADIGCITGSGSKARRADALAGLFACATADEQRFLGRLLLGELRQGALTALVVDALAAAFELPVGSVRRAQMLRGDIAEVAAIARADGRAGLDAIGLQLFRPVQPMLAQPAADLDEALAQLPSPVLDYKLDGARVQVHKQGAQVRVFSRQGNEVTAAVPEVVNAVATVPAREMVLDGETLALTANGHPLPFQTTMRRFGRHRDDAALRAELPLAVFCFDCLALDGETLIDAPTRERHRALADSLPPQLIMPRIIGADAAAAKRFLQQALAAGHEGLMAKHPDAPYAAGSRGSHWLKVKQAHTLDLVVLAAEWGSGRRQGWLSNLHLGCRDGAGGYLMLGKTFKGLTDKLLAWQTQQLLARELGRDGHVVHVRPELIVEIAFNELQQSRQYPAGLALRFARVKAYRADKTAAEADDIERVRALFARQVAYRDTGASTQAVAARA
jgi:DNA ligase-1